jgi:hypothetical protein
MDQQCGNMYVNKESILNSAYKGANGHFFIFLGIIDDTMPM